MPSVVIAAHQEEAVLGRTLDALEGQLDGLEIVVSANACTDATVDIARARGATVVDRPEPGKAAAINAAESDDRGFPRFYLDADIVVPPGGLRRLSDALRRDGILAAVPARRMDVAGRPWAVRAYVSINERLPVFRRGLFGRGLIGVSDEGRARFGRFPELIADDLFLDSQFADAEKAHVDDVVVTVAAPRTTKDLVRRLVRVRRGNAELRAAARRGEVDVVVRASDRWAWWRDVVRHDLRLLPAAGAYVAITAIAARRSRAARGSDWGRDETTRQPDRTGRSAS